MSLEPATLLSEARVALEDFNLLPPPALQGGTLASSHFLVEHLDPAKSISCGLVPAAQSLRCSRTREEQHRALCPGFLTEPAASSAVTSSPATHELGVLGACSRRQVSQKLLRLPMTHPISMGSSKQQSHGHPTAVLGLQTKQGCNGLLLHAAGVTGGNSNPSLCCWLCVAWWLKVKVSCRGREGHSTVQTGIFYMSASGRVCTPTTVHSCSPDVGTLWDPPPNAEPWNMVHLAMLPLPGTHFQSNSRRDVKGSGILLGSSLCYPHSQDSWRHPALTTEGKETATLPIKFKVTSRVHPITP